jgi:hypothetical protein
MWGLIIIGKRDASITMEVWYPDFLDLFWTEYEWVVWMCALFLLKCLLSKFGLYKWLLEILNATWLVILGFNTYVNDTRLRVLKNIITAK